MARFTKVAIQPTCEGSKIFSVKMRFANRETLYRGTSRAWQGVRLQKRFRLHDVNPIQESGGFKSWTGFVQDRTRWALRRSV